MENPADIQTYLEGIAYPVDKKGIIDHAENNGAPAAVLIALGYIPDRQYMDVVDVSNELDDDMSPPAVEEDI